MTSSSDESGYISLMHVIKGARRIDDTMERKHKQGEINHHLGQLNTKVVNQQWPAVK